MVCHILGNVKVLVREKGGAGQYERMDSAAEKRSSPAASYSAVPGTPDPSGSRGSSLSGILQCLEMGQRSQSAGISSGSSLRMAVFVRSTLRHGGGNGSRLVAIRTFFLLPGRKFQALLMKWLILFLAGFPACIIAVFGFAAVYRTFPDGTVYGMAIYLGAAVVIWIGQAVVYLLHLVLAFLFGKGVSIGVVLWAA